MINRDHQDVAQNDFLKLIPRGRRWLGVGLGKLLIAMAAVAGMCDPTWCADVNSPPDPREATAYAPFVNSLGMKFVPVLGTKVLFSVWDTRVQEYALYAHEKRVTPQKPDFEQSPTHPVVMVSFEDAQGFCEWLSKKEGLTYRLPTDAEWSVAVGLEAEVGATPEEREKKGPVDVYPWGRQWPPPAGAGNYGQSLHVDSLAKTSPVGSFAPNANGIFDLGGNVWQWCGDGPNAGDSKRVMRGGSWNDNVASALRSSARRFAVPTKRLADTGFRCVLERPRPKPNPRDAMVLVDRGNGVKPGSDYGLAFLLRMDGKVYIVTNVSVLSGPHDVKFKTMDNRELSPGSFQVADNVDIVRAEVPDEEAALEMAPKVERQLGIGGAISIMGYDQRPNVAREVTHADGTNSTLYFPRSDLQAVYEDGQKVTGIGPERIELSGNFGLRFNGAPIFLQPTRQVIGVGYWARPPLTLDGHPGPGGNFSGLPRLTFNNPHWLGYRVDTVTQWMAPAPPENVINQAKILNRMEHMTAVVARVLTVDVERLRAIDAANLVTQKDSDANLEALRKKIEDQKPYGAALFEILKSFLTEDIRDLKAEEFKGYLSLQFQDDLERRNRVIEWLNALAARAMGTPPPAAPRIARAEQSPATPKSLPPAATISPAPVESLPEPTVLAPYTNSLGMVFMPVTGSSVLYSAMDTRVQDYEVYAREKGITPAKPDFEQSPTDPVVMVSWQEARRFCFWLSEKENRTYRLPTDVEWSLAVGLKGETGSTPEQRSKKGPGDQYPWGRQWPPPAGAGNYAATLRVDAFPKTSPVGSFAANAWGIYDLGGNVWQWCADLYSGAASGYVMRGGSWADSDATLLRSAGRFHGHPDDRLATTGFRCVLELPGPGLAVTRSIVLMKSGSGHYTGFLVRMDGKIYVVTNAGALCTGHGVELKSLDNRELIPGPFQIADHADLVRAEVSGAGAVLDMLPKVDQQLSVGDTISIMGDFGERGVVRETSGTVTGISPDRVAVNAMFGPGSNGSPILLQPASQVVGVTNFIKRPPSFANASDAPSDLWQMTSAAPVDRFGYRLDAVKEWVSPAAPDSVVKQGAALHQIENMIWVISALQKPGVKGVAENGADHFMEMKNDGDENLGALRQAAGDFVAQFRATAAGERGKTNADFFELLRPFLKKDVQDLKPEQFSGYFSTQLRDDLDRLRGDLERRK